ENTIVATLRHSSGVSAARICSGKIGIRIRRNPYTPIFDSTPVSTIDTADGASLYVAGNHVWNGNKGTFTANPSSAPPNTTPASVSAGSVGHQGCGRNRFTSSPERPRSAN